MFGELESKWMLCSLHPTGLCTALTERVARGQALKLDIDDENSVQIIILTKKTVTQVWSQIMIVESKQAIRHIFFFLLWCSWYDQKTGMVFIGSFTFT